jgi:hypothetical protein
MVDSLRRGVIFDHGPWVVGKINNNIHLAIQEWNGSYSPGPIISNDAAMNIKPEDSAKYRVYKIDLNDLTNGKQDYLEWPVQFGAPVNAENQPIVYNDQTVWTIFNSIDSSISRRKRWNEHQDTLPVMPIEIHQIAYAYEHGYRTYFNDIAFFEWTIINKGSENIDSAYFGLWTDLDFNCCQNIPAVDPKLNLGYCWNPRNSGYEYIPIAAGYILNFGPAVNSSGDTAIFKGRHKPDFKNLKLTGFHGIGDDSYMFPGHPLYGPAYSLTYAWNFARGLDGEGNIMIDSSTGLPTALPFSGNPVTNTGYLFPGKFVGGGAGFAMFSGPFNLTPNDTQWVMVTFIIATGNDYKDAVLNLKNKSELMGQLSYNQLVQKHSLDLPGDRLPEKFYLSQNYPNPFNSTTKINYTIPKVPLSSYGTEESVVSIKVYDVLGREVTTLINEGKKPGKYEVEFQSTVDRKQLASGIYFYELRSGNFFQTKKMILMK